MHAQITFCTNKIDLYMGTLHVGSLTAHLIGIHEISGLCLQCASILYMSWIVANKINSLLRLPRCSLHTIKCTHIFLSKGDTNKSMLYKHTHTHTHTHTPQNTELNTRAHSHTRVISYLWGAQMSEPDKWWLLEGAPCCNRRTCCQPRVDLWLGLTFFSGPAL